MQRFGFPKHLLMVTIVLALTSCVQSPKITASTEAPEFPAWTPVFESELTFLHGTKITLQPGAGMKCRFDISTVVNATDKHVSFSYVNRLVTERRSNGFWSSSVVNEKGIEMVLSGNVSDQGVLSKIGLLEDGKTPVPRKNSDSSHRMMKANFSHFFSAAGKKLSTGTSIDKRLFNNALFESVISRWRNGRLAGLRRQKSFVIGRAQIERRSVIVIRYVIAIDVERAGRTLNTTTAGIEWVDELTGLVSGYKTESRMVIDQRVSHVAKEESSCTFPDQ